MDEKKINETEKEEVLSQKDERVKKTSDVKEKRVLTKEEKEKKWKKRIGIILCILVLLFLLGVGIYFGVVNYLVSKVNIVTEEEEEFATERITLEETETEEMEEMVEEGEFDGSRYPSIQNSKKNINVLLLATDSRSKGGAGRSDVMMLVSINKETKKIVLCSFLRDIWAEYPKEPKNPINGGYDKLNHAHAYGGANLTMAVLKETFNVKVDHYAKVDFSDFVDVVDSMGGVDLQLSSEEAGYINRAQQVTLSDSHHKGYKMNSLTQKAGVHHLNGIQALTHARNRTIGSDWARTQRQRNILTAMAKKASSLSLDQLNNLINTTLPLITTNMKEDYLKDIIASAPLFLSYEIESTKLPQEGTYRNKGSNMVTDQKVNYFYLYKTIYGQEPEAIK